MWRQWILDRCQEVQAAPNGHLDLWFREGYKSTIITFGQTLQDVLTSHGDDLDEKEYEDQWHGREATIGIFSHTRPIAKSFLRQIKFELEGNQTLKALFPDIFYDNPQKESPKWSEDDGLIVKRTSNPKESTIEAHGLVDGMPTGKHFTILNYDDVVTEKSVTTPEMMNKTTTQLELSYNLGMDGGYKRFVGSKYHLFDTYRVIEERQTVTVRRHPVTDNGMPDGKPVLISQEALDEKRRDMGPFTFGCQMLLNPQADQVQGFRTEWIRHHNQNDQTEPGNRYLLVDPANEKKKRSDYTSAVVLELREDQCYYELEAVRDRLSLTERADLVFRLHRKWGRPIVAYEKYGKDSDIQHIEDRQNREKYHFDIIPLGGAMAKNDRIRKLIPIFEQGRYFLPYNCPQVDYEGKAYDATKVFLEDEYYPFPVLSHDDMFDVKARILDPGLNAEFPEEVQHLPPPVHAGLRF
jgi:phage terminase large subunit-like protein